jgi:hypothetical protein
MQEYEQLKTLVVEIEADLNKALSGNKAAHSRRNRILEILGTE